MSQEIYRSAACCITKENGTYTLWHYTWDNLTNTTTKPVKGHEYTDLLAALEWASFHTLMYQGRRAGSALELRAHAVLMYTFLSDHPEMLGAGVVEILPEYAPGKDFLIETTDLNVRFYPAGPGQVQLIVEKDDEDLFEDVLPLGEPTALNPALDMIQRHW